MAEFMQAMEGMLLVLCTAQSGRAKRQSWQSSVNNASTSKCRRGKNPGWRDCLYERFETVLCPWLRHIFCHSSVSLMDHNSQRASSPYDSNADETVQRCTTPRAREIARIAVDRAEFRTHRSISLSALDLGER